MSDDEEFEAFLRGDDALARRLQALDQPAPPPALDAAILARARTAMERERTPAANDDAPLASGPRQPKGMGWYWRVPAGIAATILVGVIARQSFESDPGTRVYEAAAVEAAAVEAAAVEAAAVEAATVEAAPVEAAAVESSAAHDTVPTPAAEVADASAHPVQTEMPPAPPQMNEAPRKAAPAGGVQSRREPAPVVGAAPEEKPAVLMRPAPPPAAPAPVAPAAPAPAPAAAAENAFAQKSERVFITGSRLRVSRDAEGASPSTIISPEVLLERIEKMLEEGRLEEVSAAWAALQRDYPDFPIPDTTREKLNKLRR